MNDIISLVLGNQELFEEAIKGINEINTTIDSCPDFSQNTDFKKNPFYKKMKDYLGNRREPRIKDLKLFVQQMEKKYKKTNDGSMKKKDIYYFLYKLYSEDHDCWDDFKKYLENSS